MAQFDVDANPIQSAAHYAAPLPTRSLRQVVGNLTSASHVLIAAMEVVISQGFRLKPPSAS